MRLPHSKSENEPFRVLQLFLPAQVAVFENEATRLGKVVLRRLPRVLRFAEE
jgi:hypothetical protein